jgi:hypothetical protein
VWRTQPDTEPTPGLRGPLVAIASVVALGLLAFAINELYVTGLAPSADELAWLKTQRPAEHESLPTLTDQDVVTMRRSQCYGSCPAYEVTLRGSGQVDFTGEAFVCRRHVTAAAADPAGVARLFRGLEVLKFNSMPDFEHRDATDGETVTVTLTRSGSAHAVRHYYGDARAPRLLTLIEDRIDKLAGTAAWTGAPADGTVNCTLPDGRRKPVEREIPGDGAQ